MDGGRDRSEEHGGQTSDRLDGTAAKRWTDGGDQRDRREEETSSGTDGLSLKQTEGQTGGGTEQTAGLQTSRRWTKQMDAQRNV